MDNLSSPGHVSEPMIAALFAPQALLADGWATDVRFTLGKGGTIAAIACASAPDGAVELAGPVIPGMPNLHSHAFQRAMAGLTETRGPGSAGGDNFWTWRSLMYDFQSRLTPDDINAIATQLYIELVKTGYTAVGEFHYLHNTPDGTPYDDRAELSNAVISAALDVGIAITHLPVLYAFSGFGSQPLADAQKRFAGDPEMVLRIVDGLRSRYADQPAVSVGVAPHSLRAVSAEALAALVAGADSIAKDVPIHIHIAEQRREIEECIAWSGQRPVAWLLDAADVDQRWCLIHATHVVDAELQGIAETGAVVGLCPTTEANLGDGVFRLKEYARAGGRFGIGSDSNVSVSPIEELRWLEYGQRLTHFERNVSTSTQAPDTGGVLWRAAAAGGAQALAQPSGALEIGRRADLVVLDQDAVNLVGRSGDQVLNALIFAGNANIVREVWVAGRRVVTEGQHPLESETRRRFLAVMRRLLG